MQLADEVIVMSLSGVPVPLQPGDRLRFPSFGCWTVLWSEPHPRLVSRMEVALRLHMPEEDDSREARSFQKQDASAHSP